MTFFPMPDTLTVWEESSSLDKFGNASYNSPYTIEGKEQSEIVSYRDEDGNERRSNTVFYSESKIKAHWYIVRGDYTGTSDPKQVSDARLVNGVFRVSSIDGSIELYKALI